MKNPVVNSMQFTWVALVLVLLPEVCHTRLAATKSSQNAPSVGSTLGDVVEDRGASKAREESRLVPDRPANRTGVAEDPDEEFGEGGRKKKITNGLDVMWPEASSLPKILQLIFAVTWILMIAALPFVLPVVDRRPVTTCQKVVGGSMLIVLFGGLYLFTNIILFQSVHFKQVRPLTIIECIYFMSQVITTVGYGDITPAKPRGQVFVAFYVLGGVFVISMLVSQVIDHAAEQLAEYREKMHTPRDGEESETHSSATSTERSSKYKGMTHSDTKGHEHAKSVHDLLHPPKPSLYTLVAQPLAVFAIIDVIWVTFYSNFPGENKTVFQAFYMSLITLSTVGFGAFTPLTEEGMVFNAFFMLFGASSLVSVISGFCQFVKLMTEFERFSPEVKKKALDNLKRMTGGSQRVTEGQFLRFFIEYEGALTPGHVNNILEVYEALKPESGSVDLDKIVQAMEIDRNRNKYLGSGECK
jgi:hypothetical protein